MSKRIFFGESVLRRAKKLRTAHTVCEWRGVALDEYLFTSIFLCRKRRAQLIAFKRFRYETRKEKELIRRVYGTPAGVWNSHSSFTYSKIKFAFRYMQMQCMRQRLCYDCQWAHSIEPRTENKCKLNTYFSCIIL